MTTFYATLILLCVGVLVLAGAMPAIQHGYASAYAVGEQVDV